MESPSSVPAAVPPAVAPAGPSADPAPTRPVLEDSAASPSAGAAAGPPSGSPFGLPSGPPAGPAAGAAAGAAAVPPAGAASAPSAPAPEASASAPAIPEAAALQATLFDFAIGELVRQHRDSFPPPWSVESWAKLLIWLALNCGCSTDPAALEAFAAALGPVLTGRLRRIFFERELEDLDLQVMADPAERQVLVLPLGPVAGSLDPEQVAAALERVGLLALVAADRGRWQALDAVTAIPWAEPCA